ncbi:hypothetical protein BDY19DRAFT_923782 [Irpex rosettiformis]|uniref:Uncharacterized protein n=1 Tax=Irpex rosettiformis TaxID=378272 RepID=A0ACB8UGG9_9APHY|nr:hypothetical protein BDY19DRAFT_923782 [Irpex rosettiformis]
MTPLLKLITFTLFAALFSGIGAFPTANGLHKRSQFLPLNPLTNAQRIAQGFVLKPPQRRTPGRIYARVSPTPTDVVPQSPLTSSQSVIATPSDPASSSAAPSSNESSSIPAPPTSSSALPSSSSASSSSSPSATPTAITCPARSTFMRGYIKAVSQDGATTIGYVSASTNPFGEFGLASNVESALIFNSCKPSIGLMDLTIENAPTVSQPFLGFFKGSASTDASIGYSSANYMFLGGVQHTGVTAPQNLDTSFKSGTSLPSESTVWTLDIFNRFATQWINPDFTSPVTSLAYVPADDVFILTGNFNKFTSTYGSATRVTLSYVAIEN